MLHAAVAVDNIRLSYISLLYPFIFRGVGRCRKFRGLCCLMSAGSLILFGSVVPSHAKKRPGYDCSRGSPRVHQTRKSTYAVSKRVREAASQQHWVALSNAPRGDIVGGIGCVCNFVWGERAGGGNAFACVLVHRRWDHGGIDVRYQRDIIGVIITQTIILEIQQRHYYNNK